MIKKTFSLAPLATAIFGTTLLGSVSIALSPAAHAETGYHRAPAIHADKVVFTAEGDLWLSHLDGSVTKRLTTHASEEIGDDITRN